MTTAFAAVSGIGDPSARARRALAVILGDLLSATLAAAGALAVAAPLTSYDAAALVLGWVLVQAIGSRPAPLDGAREDRIRVLRGAALAVVACWLAGDLLPAPAAVMAGFVAVSTCGSLLVRTIRTGEARGLRTLVVGDPEETGGVVARLARATSGRLVGAGACSPAELAETLTDGSFDLVLAVPGPSLSDRALQRVGWQLEAVGLPLLVSTRMADVAADRTRVARVGGLNVLHLAPAQRRGAASRLKTAWECVAAAVLLLAIAPVLLAVTIAVRLDSPGPVIFRQRRVGRGGTTFTMLKFRTMHVDAPERLAELRERCDSMLFKMEDDPRITRVGRLLRRYSLDELPQLVNVVRGEMALVGPRPALPEEVAAYDDDPRHRLVVRPGVTGLWQVSGRSDLSWDESVRLDLDYVDNWSIGRDLVILVRTVGAVLGHRGAY